MRDKNSDQNIRIAFYSERVRIGMLSYNTAPLQQSTAHRPLGAVITSIAIKENGYVKSTKIIRY